MTALGCTGGSNSNIYIGAQNDGIVAYAAPLVSNPLVPGPADARTDHFGRRGRTELPPSVIRDSLDYVYGSTALTTGGTKNEVIGRIR